VISISPNLARKDRKGTNNAMLWRSYANRGLHAIPVIKRAPQFISLDLSDNPLRDFTGLPALPFLKVLRVDNTDIQSFKGALLFPSLETLSIREAPVTRNPHFTLMALLAFGTTVTVLNGRYLSAERIRPALDPEVRRWFLPWLREGYVIVDLQQKLVWQPGAKSQVLLDLPPDEVARRRHRIEQRRKQIEALKKRKLLIERGAEAPAEPAPQAGEEEEGLAEEEEESPAAVQGTEREAPPEDAPAGETATVSEALALADGEGPAGDAAPPAGEEALAEVSAAEEAPSAGAAPPVAPGGPAAPEGQPPADERAADESAPADARPPPEADPEVAGTDPQPDPAEGGSKAESAAEIGDAA
jgi:hypothetical protein